MLHFPVLETIATLLVVTTARALVPPSQPVDWAATMIELSGVPPINLTSTPALLGDPVRLPQPASLRVQVDSDHFLEFRTLGPILPDRTTNQVFPVWQTTHCLLNLMNQVYFTRATADWHSQTSPRGPSLGPHGLSCSANSLTFRIKGVNRDSLRTNDAASMIMGLGDYILRYQARSIGIGFFLQPRVLLGSLTVTYF